MAAGAILAFFSHLAPRFGAGNFIRERDVPKLFGKAVTRREAYLFGILAHLFLSACFGFAFAFLVEFRWLTGFRYTSMWIFVVGLTLVIGLVVMPLEGHGLFGRRHDAWFMVDAFVTNALWGHLFLGLAGLWFLA